MGGNAGASSVIYETNEKGQRVMVKSIEGTSVALLRFTNRTSCPVDVWWRNYQGAKQHYARLDPGGHYDVKSYITHPWESTDETTKERYFINNQLIYRPPINIGGKTDRTNCDITIDKNIW